MFIFQLTVVGVNGNLGQDVQLIAKEGQGKGPEHAPTQPPLMAEMTVREKSRSRKIVTNMIVQVNMKVLILSTLLYNK